MADFDRVSAEFVNHYDTVRGFVRQQLVQNNLAKHLGTKRLSIIDVGGGDGRDAAWLASLGHDVVLVDPSSKMLTLAKHRFKAEGAKVETHQLEPEAIAQFFRGQQFDVVLSHAVLMYCVDTPVAHLQTLAKLVKPSGLISLLTKGLAGAVAREMTRGETTVADTILHTGFLTNNLRLPILALDSKQVTRLLNKATLLVDEWYGVRIVTDFDKRPLSTVKATEIDKILSIETALSSQPDTKGIGQMLHFIVRPNQ